MRGSKMKRWGWTILIALALATVAVTTSPMPVEAQEEVSAIAPGGSYYIYVTAKKPSYMSLTDDWEIRFYVYNGTNCFNKAPSGTDGGWWLPDGSTTWLYTGYWDYRVRNQAWTANEMTWYSTVRVINRPASTDSEDKEMRYPPAVGENYEGKMSELPDTGDTVTVKARFLFRKLNPTFEGDYVTFKVGTNTYRYKVTKVYDDYELEDLAGTKGTLSQSEGTGEWRLQFDLTKQIMVDDNAPSTGKITLSGTLDFSGLTPAGLSIPIELILAGGIILVVAIAVIFLVRRRGAEELPPVPEFAPPPPPEAPPAPPEAPPAPPEAPPETPPGEQPPAWALVSTP